MSILDSVYQDGPLKEAMAQTPGRYFEDEEDRLRDTPYEDYDFLRNRIDEFVADVSKTRWQFERGWFENFLFYIGNQWIVFDKNKRVFRERHMRKWVPRPYTNRFASTCDSIVGVLMQNKVNPSVWPSTDDADDLAATSVAEKVKSIIREEIKQDEVAQRLAPLIVLNADGFLLPYYDKADNSLGERTLKHEYCMFCGYEAEAGAFGEHCPECHMITVTQEGKTTTTYNYGRMKVEALTPLELFLDQETRIMSDVRRWTRVRNYPIDVIRATWPKTGQYVSTSREAATKESQHYLEIITYITQDAIATTSRSHTRIAPVYTHFEMPSEQFPEGLLCVKAGDGTILEVGPSPWVDKSQGKTIYYQPLTKFAYNAIPNRLYSKTPAYDLVNKQKQRNRLESLIELAMMKGTYNSWILPTGSSISQVTGEPAQLIRWTPTGTQGAEPKIVTNAPIPNVVMGWLEKIDSDMEELAGTYDALKGQPPRGVSAGYAIQLLTERSYGRLAPLIDNWQRGWTEVYHNLLRIFRNNVTEERLYKIRGETGQWEVERFVGADLVGSVDLKVEGGSSKPKTKLAEQALVETLAKLGVINGQDPTQRFAIAELFGMSHILGSTSEDYRHAAREWELFKQGEVPEVKLAVDNHIVHALDHQKRAKTDVFRQWPQQQQDHWMNHIMHHLQAAQMGLAGGQGQPPATGGASSGASPNPTSKANETSDRTMATVRQGGNVTMGSGGHNQHA